jgi:hypothetical protein
VTILRTLGWKTAAGYLFTVIICALGAGLSLDMLFPQLGSTVQAHMHQMDPSAVGNVSAVLLLTMLILAILSGKKHSKTNE